MGASISISSKVIEPCAESRSPLTLLWWREYTQPHARFQVMTPDGIVLRGAHLQSGHDRLVIYCHGFVSSKNYTAVPRFAEMLAESADVIAFDFRGHGESEGASTLGEREVLDLGAVVEYARDFNYRQVFLVGSSMGGAVAIRYAAACPEIAGVATIGAFAHHEFSWLAMQSLRFLRYPVTRRVLRAVRQARIESFTPHSHPIDVVPQISPRPVLLIHGELDPLIPVSHARALYARAGEPKRLIVIPHGSHDIPNLNRRTKEWIVEWMAEETRRQGDKETRAYV
jgi:pimeloyl-ACP methyl ester carboxylesterase